MAAIRCICVPVSGLIRVVLTALPRFCYDRQDLMTL
jgi:hypothetical protein